jgi:hypothetical protein
MTDIAISRNPAHECAAARGEPWKFWGTTFWGVALLAIFFAAQLLGIIAGVVWLLVGDPDLSDERLGELMFLHAAAIVPSLVAVAVFVLPVLALAVRFRRVGLRDYLALVRPRAHDLKIGVAGLAALYIIFGLVFKITGRPLSPKFVVDLYQSARSFGIVPALAFAIVVLGPITEELLMRGFLFRGWSASRFGVSGAIVLTAAVWTLMHTQYDWVVLMDVLCIGLLLGWIRQRSGSTLPCIFLHATQNAAALVQVAILDALGNI